MTNKRLISSNNQQLTQSTLRIDVFYVVGHLEKREASRNVHRTYAVEGSSKNLNNYSTAFSCFYTIFKPIYFSMITFGSSREVNIRTLSTLSTMSFAPF